MTTYSLTLQKAHLEELTKHLIRDDGCEHAAYILCNMASTRSEPWTLQAHTNYLVDKVIPVLDNQVIESTQNRISWRTASLIPVLKEAENNNQVFGIIHNHPNGLKEFSAQDDANEPDLVQLAVNRNGYGTNMLSLILTEDGTLRGRVWTQPKSNSFESMRMIRVVGYDRIGLHYSGRGDNLSMPAFQRQALAFGHALNQDLKNLRITIVGCGGTGSAVATLLARLGVGQIALIDNDTVDQTNLNRLHGARQADADAMRPKVNVIADVITEMGLGVRVVPIKNWIDNHACRDVLRSSDIIFGCTDDHKGRLSLNRYAYYYLIPVIDLGLAIDASGENSVELKALDGRVTVLSPNQTCLVCRGVINHEMASSEALRRSDPEEFEQRKAEAYVLGEGNPNPAVVTFTTELACMAVNEMIHRLQGFRGEGNAIPNRVHKFKCMTDIKAGHTPRESCKICGSDEIWGKGDTEPFLGVVD